VSGGNPFALVLGRNLTRCRERIGISQEELGFMADLHRTAIGQLERGERVARTDTLVRLCGSLGVGAEELLAGLRWRPPLLSRGELEIEEGEPTETSETEKSKGAKPETQRSKREPARNPGGQRCAS
jgi:transcriptional regulator with XRE-family HTH domain